MTDYKLQKWCAVMLMMFYKSVSFSLTIVHFYTNEWIFDKQRDLPPYGVDMLIVNTAFVMIQIVPRANNCRPLIC